MVPVAKGAILDFGTCFWATSSLGGGFIEKLRGKPHVLFHKHAPQIVFDSEPDRNAAIGRDTSPHLGETWVLSGPRIPQYKVFPPEYPVLVGT